MQIIELNGQNWRSKQDFYDALASALGSVEWHGRNADAFLETMVYTLELNRVQPPYEVNIHHAPDELQPFLTDFASWVEEACQDRLDDPNWGDAVEVRITLA
ncbi:MAG: barstar family protein [Erythrobacter sp.]